MPTPTLHPDPLADPLDDLLARHRRGEAVGVYAVCSAHPLVLRAAVEQAVADGSVLLVEATSNQVDQHGGYTGWRPADFRDLVHRLADRAGLDRGRVVLGGDHLGPNTWRDLPGAVAMEHAVELVETYAAAGFTKLHLDTSMRCADDPEELDDELVAGRAVRLAAAAEAVVERRGLRPPAYVVGTEVPPPGGAAETIEALRPTTPEAAEATWTAHRAAFTAAGLDAAWSRVRALVVQPGVEFDHARVVDYEPTRATALSRVLDGHPGLVYEAHSTDYQTRERLRRLVTDHWAVLKVGPGLTFALREALFALAAIEDELVEPERRSGLVQVVEEVMLAQPRWWRSHHEGADERATRLALRYSYSDRMRYYWPEPRIAAAQQVLLDNLAGTGIPLPLLSRHLPVQYARVRQGLLPGGPVDPVLLVVDRVREVLRDYAWACGHAGS